MLALKQTEDEYKSAVVYTKDYMGLKVAYIAQGEQFKTPTCYNQFFMYYYVN